MKGWNLFTYIIDEFVFFPGIWFMKGKKNYLKVFKKENGEILHILFVSANNMGRSWLQIKFF